MLCAVRDRSPVPLQDLDGSAEPHQDTRRNAMNKYDRATIAMIVVVIVVLVAGRAAGLL